MSCEPGRTTAYSVDMRWRVVWQRIAMGLSFRAISHRLNIAVGTAFNIYNRFVQTGSVEAKKVKKRPEKFTLDHHHRLYIIAIVLENPSTYLKEICFKIKQITNMIVTPSMICKILSRHGFSRKKIQHVALQRSLIYRAAYLANCTYFPKEMLVWVDETGCDKRDMLRRYGYSFRGQKAVCRRLLVRGRRISAIAALTCQGILDVAITTQTIDGEKFCDFIRGCLIPNMLPFNGTNQSSVVIMDNCSIHHVQAVSEMLSFAGIVLVYLPPYSPDLNPIEEAFGYIKGYLKEHEELIDAFPNPIPIVQSAFDSVTEQQALGWVSDCKCYN